MIAMLLATMLFAGQPTPAPHECGKGPVTLTLQVPGGDCNTCHCEQIRTGEAAYVQGACSCTVAMCWTDVKQKWTDWPECGGTEIPSLTTDLTVR